MPCIGEEIKGLILQEYPELEVVLDKLPDCADPRGLKLKGRQSNKEGGVKRQPSEYNIHISKCMKSKNIKGFGNAAPAMKECARAWKERPK